MRPRFRSGFTTDKNKNKEKTLIFQHYMFLKTAKDNHKQRKHYNTLFF